jgi:outer membrane receptor protein involved in Fe transport
LVWGPGLRNFDVEIGKRFYLSPLREGANLEFRAEFYNVTNTPYFNNPNVTIGSGTVGRITSVSNDPRRVQLGMKLHW